MALENEQADGAEPQSDSQTAKDIEDRLSKAFEQDGEAPRGNARASQPEPKTEDVDHDGKSEEGDGLEEVEYGGETYRVAPALKEAIIQKADYTQKSQANADRARQIDLQNEQLRLAHLEQEFERSVSNELRTIGLIETRQQLLLDNWNTISADEKQEITLLDKQREKVQREIDGKRNEFGEGMKKHLTEFRQKAAEAVAKAIPNWSPQLQKDITEHAISEGYTNQELSSIADPRHIKTLWKAREYDRLKAQAKAKPPEAKVAKPGPSNPMPDKVKQNFAFQKQMKQASTPAQKARLIEEKFAKQFGG